MAELPLKNQSKSLTTNLLIHLISVIQWQTVFSVSCAFSLKVRQ